MESHEPLGVILTAGLGTRLKPLTPSIPKPLVPLLNRSLVTYSLDLMASFGLRDIAIVVGPDDTKTEPIVLEHASADMQISVATQHKPRGTGDAVTAVGTLLDERSIVVLAVDTVLRGANPLLLQKFQASGATAGLLLKGVEDPRAFGVAVLKGDRIVDLEEKPTQPHSNLALVGLWMLAPNAVEHVRTKPYINANGESDLTATIAKMLDEGNDLRGWILEGEWFDGGTLSGLLHAQSRLLQCTKELAEEADYKQLNRTTVTAANVRIHDSQIDEPVLIGEGAMIKESHLSEVVVGAGAILESVELTRVLIAPGTRLSGGSYRDVVVTPDGEIAGPGLERR